MGELTETDQRILESYIPVLEGLAVYLCGSYELILYSLADYEHSVLCIFNGEHTACRTGMPLPEKAVKMLHTIEHEHLNSVVYFTRNQDHEPLRSTLIAIRGHQGHLIGLLCINLYLSSSIQEFANSLISLPEGALPGAMSEFFAQDTSELVLNAFEEEKQRVEQDSSTTPGKYNKLIIEALDSRGIFQIKNAVSIVASKLNISKNTVYMHLRKLRACPVMQHEKN